MLIYCFVSFTLLWILENYLNFVFNRFMHFRPNEVLHATPSICLMGCIMLINCVQLTQMGHYKGQSMKNKALFFGTKGLGVS